MSVHKVDYFVIPAEAGIQNRLKSLDSRFHGNDGKAIYKQTLIYYSNSNQHCQKIASSDILSFVKYDKTLNKSVKIKGKIKEHRIH